MDTDIHSSFTCNSQKLNNAESKKPEQKEIHTVVFHLYINIKNAN